MPLRWRQIKQEYWADSLLHKKLSAVQREFYVGLWMLADDLGWFRADPEMIGAELYRFRPVDDREAEVKTSLEVLANLGRIEVRPCGHAFIPKLRRYQHTPAKDKGARTFWREHQQCSGGDDDPVDEDPVDQTSPGVLVGPQALAPTRDRSQDLAGIGKESREERSRDKVDGHPLNEANTLEGVVAFIHDRWRFESSSRQRTVIADVADHLAQGSHGFRRVREILGSSGDPDPIAALIAYDRRLKEQGVASALAQEEESAKWRRSSISRSGGGFTSIDGRTPAIHQRKGRPQETGLEGHVASRCKAVSYRPGRGWTLEDDAGATSTRMDNRAGAGREPATDLALTRLHRTKRTAG